MPPFTGTRPSVGGVSDHGALTGLGDDDHVGYLTVAEADAVYAALAGATFTGDVVVPADSYGTDWNASNEAPTKNDIYDQIETRTVSTQYDPAVIATYTTTSATAVDVDAANLAVTFTAPPSGNVVVTLNAECNIADATSNQYWTLRDGSGVVAGVPRPAFILGESTAAERVTAMFKVTGLTPGTSYTWKWAFLRSGTSANCNLFAGGAAGPASMKVEAVAA